MPGSIWLGPIYLKEEGGYDLVFRALCHYKKRLSSIESSPELSDAPIFVQIIKQEATKTLPKISFIINQITEGLQKPALLKNLQGEIPTIQKALESYGSDLKKALDSKHKYYESLIPNSGSHVKDLTQIKTALKKINEFF